MADSFFFYDLETTGISSRRDRIMQFAGQRTDANLKPIGEPYNLFIKLAPDILPTPEAILLTGLLPKEGIDKGISEAEFARIFNEQIATDHTIFIGYNNLRFDDEFIRFLNYRNFYDAYEWHWRNNNSRWDLLDLVRMTRALRPEGINWPVTDEGKPTNRLELLTKANDLSHDSAHDALSDVVATIEVAKLIRSKQPKLFNFLLNHRKKDQVLGIVDSKDAFAYTSSHYSSLVLHTTAVAALSVDDNRASALVYDLRHDPKQFLELSVDELVERWQYDPQAKTPRLPIKTMKFNRCPAIAPLGVLNDDSLARLNLDLSEVAANLQVLMANKEEFSLKLKEVVKALDSKRNKQRQKPDFKPPSVDQQLYDNFLPKADQAKFPVARQQAAKAKSQPMVFEDERLNGLFKLYRARNYPEVLDSSELQEWRSTITQKLFDGGQTSQWQEYKNHLGELRDQYRANKAKLKLIDELESYGQSIEDAYAAY